MKKSPPPPRPRGRPRSFDEAEVLSSLLEVFWESGFSRASLEDLEVAAGLNRPSLYGAFGDKQQMYLRALAAFEARMVERLGPTLHPSKPLADGLRAFYEQALELYTGGAARGCMVLSTAVAEAVADPAARKALTAVLARLDVALERRFTQAQQAGELTSTASPRSLALTATAVLHSLSLRARAGLPRARLVELIDAGLEVVLQAPRQGA
jgi:AcrR family transcriptional regulator